MIVSIAMAVMVVVLAALSYMMGRRAGVLCLALLAGATFAHYWAIDLTPRVAEAGLVLVKPPLSSVLALFLTVFPAILLMLGGPKHSTRPHRLFGSLLFGVFAVILLLEPIANTFVIDDMGQTVLETLTSYRPIIITACLVLALLDILHVNARGAKDAKHHK